MVIIQKLMCSMKLRYNQCLPRHEHSHEHDEMDNSIRGDPVAAYPKRASLQALNSCALAGCSIEAEDVRRSWHASQEVEHRSNSQVDGHPELRKPSQSDHIGRRVIIHDCENQRSW